MWFVVLIVGVALLILARQACLITGDPHLWPAYLLVGAIVLPATVVSLVDGMSTTFMAAPVYLIVIATVGGVLGVTLAGLGEFGLQSVLGELPRIAVALVEEASKLIIPLVALLLVRRDAANGLIIGMASGGGFAVVETLGYTGAVMVRAGTTLTDVDEMLWERGIFSPATHIAWTGLASCALGFAFERRWSLIAVLSFLGAFSLAVLLHTLWDAKQHRWLCRPLGCERCYNMRNRLPTGHLQARARTAVTDQDQRARSLRQHENDCCLRKHWRVRAPECRHAEQSNPNDRANADPTRAGRRSISGRHIA
jgi:RsiW-degrading membrane proteinase PrsW (M82 family)